MALAIHNINDFKQVNFIGELETKGQLKHPWENERRQMEK